MKTFKEHDVVIYSDKKGNLYDTFVVFDTDPATGLTHINHCNLLVKDTALQLHPRFVATSHIPMNDTCSFQLFKLLKEKHSRQRVLHMNPAKSKSSMLPISKLSKAS